MFGEYGRVWDVWVQQQLKIRSQKKMCEGAGVNNGIVDFSAFSQMAFGIIVSRTQQIDNQCGGDGNNIAKTKIVQRFTNVMQAMCVRRPTRV